MNDSFLANEVTHHSVAVVEPKLARLDVTIVVFFLFKDENIKCLVSDLLSVLRFVSLSLHLDIVTNLGDIRL